VFEGGSDACHGCQDASACNFDPIATTECTTETAALGYCSLCEQNIGCDNECGSIATYDACGFCVGGLSPIPWPAGDVNTDSIFMDSCGCCADDFVDTLGLDDSSLANYCGCGYPDCSCKGCTDPLGCNYDESATYGDSSTECVYPNYKCNFVEPSPHPGPCQLGQLACSDGVESCGSESYYGESCGVLGGS
jgi:hypothetical protein